VVSDEKKYAEYAGVSFCENEGILYWPRQEYLVAEYVCGICIRNSECSETLWVLLKLKMEFNNLRGIPAVPLGCLSFFTQRFFQLRPEDSPAPADFLGLDLAVCDALQVGRAGYFKILAGLFGGENVILTDSVFDYTRPTMTILPAVEAVAAVGFFALFFFAAALRIAFAYHKCFSHFQPCVIKFGNILTLSHKAAFFIFNE
jgi:hypothetical protein